jgi:hypothetical protein
MICFGQITLLSETLRNLNIAARGSELSCINQLILVDNGSYLSAQAEIQ